VVNVLARANVVQLQETPKVNVASAHPAGIAMLPEASRQNAAATVVQVVIVAAHEAASLGIAVLVETEAPEVIGDQVESAGQTVVRVDSCGCFR
jgi:hypothetical protein